MTGEKIVDTLKVSADEGALMIEYATLAEGATNKNNQLVEKLYANGKRSYHFVGANDETQALSGETEKKKPKTNEQMVHYYVNLALDKITKCKNGWEGMLKDKQALEALAVRKQVKLPK